LENAALLTVAKELSDFVCRSLFSKTDFLSVRLQVNRDMTGQ
jgi:hypothetical protein